EPFIKLLLLTGQRRGEVADMRWSEIDGDVWTLPPSRTKNKQKHQVPLSSQAMTIIENVNRVAGDFVLTTTGESGLGGFSKAKARIDDLMKPAKPWVLHDLRRTCAAGMQRLGFPVEVIERALNHKSGRFAGIVQVYQVDKLHDQTRAALQAWSDHVT